MSVPYFRPNLGEEEEEAVRQVIRSGWLTTGPVTKQLEEDFCRLVCSRHAVAVNSCSSGLHAALLAAGVTAGDEVITTPLTFCSSVRAIEMTGARPVLADIGSDLNIDTASIEQARTERTKAMLPVHIGGLPCDMNRIEALAKANGWSMVEDAAHALGASQHGKPVGSSSSSTAVFSFHANKNLTTGEGGMVTTDDDALAGRLRRIAYLGIERASSRVENRWQYDITEPGFKYNLSDVLAAIGVAQLRKFSAQAARREAIARCYGERFSESAELTVAPTRPDCHHAWHLYILRLNLNQLTVSRDEFISLLSKRGVGCSVHFRPVPMLQAFAHYGPMENWPVTQREYPRLLSLPIYPDLTEGEQEYVIEQVLDLVACCRKRVYAAAVGTGV